MYVRDDAPSFPTPGTGPSESTHADNGNGLEFASPTAQIILGEFMAEPEGPGALTSPPPSGLVAMDFSAFGSGCVGVTGCASE